MVSSGEGVLQESFGSVSELEVVECILERSFLDICDTLAIACKEQSMVIFHVVNDFVI